MTNDFLSATTFRVLRYANAMPADRFGRLVGVSARTVLRWQETGVEASRIQNALDRLTKVNTAAAYFQYRIPTEIDPLSMMGAASSALIQDPTLRF